MKNLKDYRISADDVRKVINGSSSNIWINSIIYIVNGYIDDVVDGSDPLAARSLIKNLHRDYLLAYSEFKELVNMIVPVIEYDIDTKFETGLIDKALNDIRSLTTHGIKLINTNNILEKHKQKIVVTLLKYVKDYNNYSRHTITDKLSTLKRAGITWPEIEIIEKSINTIKLDENTVLVTPDRAKQLISKYASNPKLSVDSLINSLFTYKNMGGNIAAIESEAKELLLPRISKTITKKNFYKVYRDLSRLAILFNWEELKDIKIRMIPFFISSLHSYKQQEGFQDTASFAESLIVMFKEKPDILELVQNQMANVINSMKPKIMKDLLITIKNKNFGPATRVIFYYKMIGINWPELEIIEKSISARNVKGN